MSTTGGGPPAGVATLLFDVLGTVVDEAGSVAAETARALAAAGTGTAQADHVAMERTRRVETLTGQVAAGEAPWRSNDALRRETLLEALRTAGPGGLPPALAGDQALADHQALIDDRRRSRTCTAVSAPGAQAYPTGRTEESTSAPAGSGGSEHGRGPASAPGADTAFTFNCRAPSRPEGLPWLLEPPVNVLRLAPGGDGGADDRFDVYATDLADLAQRLMRGAGPAR